MSAAGSAGIRLLRLVTPPAAAEAAAAPAEAPTALAAASRPLAVAELLVPADSRIFAGHFPGRPLLPGVAHLALLSLVLGEPAARALLPSALAGATGIVEVCHLRLRRPVAPGDRLELRLAAGNAPDLVRFEVRRLKPPLEPVSSPAPDAASPPGELASEGKVRVARTAARIAAAPEAIPPEVRAVGLSHVEALGRMTRDGAAIMAGAPGAGGMPAVTALLPHAPPALLLAEVIAADGGGIVASGVIPADHPLAAGGEAPGYLAIELAAQAAAALEALSRQPGGTPRLGYLVGVRDARLAVSLPTGCPLRVIVTPSGGAAALSTYDMEVTGPCAGAGTEPGLASGRISTFLLDP